MKIIKVRTKMRVNEKKRAELIKKLQRKKLTLTIHHYYRGLEKIPFGIGNKATGSRQTNWGERDLTASHNLTSAA